MKNTWLGVVLVVVTLVGGACSTGPLESSSNASHTSAPPPEEAPVGFDNITNGFVEQSKHWLDQSRFEETESIAGGLGPLFNAQSCRECHQSPVTGGVSQATELRAGHKGPGGKFRAADVPINGGDAVIRGRTLINARAICPSADFPNTDIQERLPESENIHTLRASISVLGSGFVEALDDATLQGLSKKQCAAVNSDICGQTVKVPVLESLGVTRFGRFGWKNQHASLLSFSADAYLNEMGITNELLATEVTNLCNTAPEPNDRRGADGLTDLEHFARFLRATKAPPRDARRAATAAAKKGATLFDEIGCSTCHVPTLKTAPAGTPVNGGTLVVPGALGNKIFHPYSDYLLHDVGTGDGIVVAMVEHYGQHVYDIDWKGLSLENFEETANKIRTTPLWGVRMRPALMHDAASLTFQDAIKRHRGEASEVTTRFQRLRHADQDAIVEFLKSL